MRGGFTAAVLAYAAWCSACGGAGSQATPTAPTTPATGGARTLSISGATNLTAGATSQLSVSIISGSGTTTPSAVTWQTRDVSIATVSGSGLLTALAAGTTFVSATADGLFAQSVVTVQSAHGTPNNAITACGLITTPGSYVLAQDLTANPGGNCLTFSNVADIHLDCQGHSITGVTGLALSSVNNASVQGCTVAGRMTMSKVTSVTVSRSTIQDDLMILSSASIVVSDSTVLPRSTGVAMVGDSGVQLLRDTITPNKAIYGVFINGGMNNQVLQSTFTGGYSGAGNTGADDAVILFDETGDTIQGNTISNFYDTAIEGLDSVSNTTISDNTGSNLGYTGIGAFWCTSWTNNIVRGNHMSNAPNFGYFDYRSDPDHCGHESPPQVFSGNQFIGNVFRDRTPNANGASLEIIVPGSVSGNLVQGNDFGSYDGPYLTPITGFIDGGGNICGPMNPAVSNFPCSGGS